MTLAPGMYSRAQASLFTGRDRVQAQNSRLSGVPRFRPRGYCCKWHHPWEIPRIIRIMETAPLRTLASAAMHAHSQRDQFPRTSQNTAQSPQEERHREGAELSITTARPRFPNMSDQARLRLRTPSRNTSERLLGPSPRDEGGGLRVEYSYAAPPSSHISRTPTVVQPSQAGIGIILQGDESLVQNSFQNYCT